jgi:hypothetical protein
LGRDSHAFGNISKRITGSGLHIWLTVISQNMKKLIKIQQRSIPFLVLKVFYKQENKKDRLIK